MTEISLIVTLNNQYNSTQLVLTILIRYMTEIHDNQHTGVLIYMHMFKFI